MQFTGSREAGESVSRDQDYIPKNASWIHSFENHRLRRFAIRSGVVQGVHGKDLQITKSSAKERFDAQQEVKAYYLQLLSGNAEIKRQFDSLTKKGQENGGGDFRVFDAQVVGWYPSEDQWNVATGFDSDDYYLVIQPVGFGRGRAAGHDLAIISLFHVQHTGTTKYDEKDEKNGSQPTLVSNKITITFLGFQHLTLRPVTSGK